jgi:hypothetical protein
VVTACRRSRATISSASRTNGAIPGRPDHRSSSRYAIQWSDEACSPGGSMNAGVFEPGGWTHFSYPCQPLRHLCPQSSSASRFAAGAFGFLSQSFGGSSPPLP